MAKRKKPVDPTADVRISGKLSPEYHKALGRLAEYHRRSLTGQTEVLVMAAVDEAIENGIIDPIESSQYDTTSPETISYDAAIAICKAHSIDGAVKLKAVGDTATTLNLDAEELLSRCRDAGLRIVNGNGHKAKVGTTA